MSSNSGVLRCPRLLVLAVAAFMSSLVLAQAAQPQLQYRVHYPGLRAPGSQGPGPGDNGTPPSEPPDTGVVTLSRSAPSLGFATRQIGTTSPAQTVTITNSGTRAATLGTPAVADSSGNYWVSSTCTSTLAVGASCAVTVSYSPQSVASHASTLTIPANAAAGDVVIPVTGQGANDIALAFKDGSGASTNGLNFGTTYFGTEATQTIRIANDAAAEGSVLQVSAATASSSKFVVAMSSGGTASNCSSLSSMTIARGTYCALTVTLLTDAVADYSTGVTLNVTSNAVSSSSGGSVSPAQLPMAGAVRGYSSCVAWLAAVPGSASGTYPLDNGAGGTLSAYCDMTSNGGGWTLVMHGRSLSDTNSVAWWTTGAVNAANAVSATGGTFKFSDATINSLKTQAYRVVTGTTTRYFRPTCTYGHMTTPAKGSACQVSYETLAWSGATTSTYGACPWHKGLVDSDNNCAGVGTSGYVITNHNQASAPSVLWVTGSNTPLSTSGGVANAEFWLWVR